MLTRLRLENFKCWQNTGDIPLRPITGFFGTNSSGKTSLIQALLLLKQTAESRDSGLVFDFGDADELVDLGNFESVVYMHDTSNALTISLDWEMLKPFRVPYWDRRGRPVNRSNKIGFEVTVQGAVGFFPGVPWVKRMSYHVGNVTLGVSQNSNSEYSPFIEGAKFQPNIRKRQGRLLSSRRERLRRLLPSSVKCYVFPDETRVYFRNLWSLDNLEFEIEQCLEMVHYLGPLRAYPQRIYSLSGALPTDMGLAGESTVAAIVASRGRSEKISTDNHKLDVYLEEYIAQWLQKIGLIHEFSISPIAEGRSLFEVKVRKSPNSAEVLLSDVGFGVSQILPALALCFYAPEGSTVILEQPEIHLHPFAQSALADVFIDAWKKRKVQIVVESHSEHLLNRLQRRIAEAEIDSNDVSLFFCSTNDDRSELTKLDVDRYGNISNWPTNFFGDQFGEVAAMSRAAIQRQMEG